MSIASLYPSINPSLLLDFANSKVLDPRITFTRTTTATYYDGVTTAKAEQNLYLYSQQLDNTAYWVHTNITVTANATTAPDGTSTADSILETTTNGQHRIYSLLTVSGTNTISIFAKANGRNYIALWFSGVDKGKFFNITAGGGGSVGNNFINAPDGSSITYLGNDWYRCTVTVNGLTGTESGLCNLSTDGSTFTYAGDVTKGAYLWGFQLEQRSSATAYTATTTQAITNYIPVLQTASAGQARFDHNPTTGESLGLLIEEARTNLCLRSAEFDNASWSKTSATVTANQSVAPDGTISGDQIVFSGAGSYENLTQSVSVSSSVAYTFTVWLRGTAGQTVSIVLFDGPTVDVTTVTLTAAFARYSVTHTIHSSVSSVQCVIQSRPGDTAKWFYAWGAQLEAGSFATSYIPTAGLTATRNADAASMTGTNFSSWFNGGAGTVFTESLPISATGSSRVCAFSDGSSSNRILIIAATGNHLYVDAYGSNVADLDGGTYSSSVFNKQGSGYAVNDYAVTINGGAIASDSSGATPIGINVLYIGADSNGTSNILNGRIRKLAYYPIRVTNAQLQALTV